jgi:glycosyltransferase involved in cell wall biosynthesis
MMKIAYVTTYDARSLTGSNEWSGTGYYIAKSLDDRQDVNLDYIGPLTQRLGTQIIQKCKSRYYQFFQNKHYEKDADLPVLKDYAGQISKTLANIDADIVFSATLRPIVYLECKQPIIFWADATCANLVDFYSQYSNLCQESLENWHMMEKLALEKCRLAIYASDWAAQSAIDYYGADPAKVKVVPFGANIASLRSSTEIKNLIASRSSERCKLLFIGVDWYRKGGDVALQVATELNNLGLDTELTVVGCEPIVEGTLPNFVKSLGFISKSTAEGQTKLDRLIAESHFLIVPSRAECYGVVFCEANSFGVPCLSRKVGGISTIIKQDVNGSLFEVNADTSEYCKYIYRLFTNYADYQKLAISAFYEYELRLNWEVAGGKVQNLLEEIL